MQSRRLIAWSTVYCIKYYIHQLEITILVELVLTTTTFQDTLCTILYQLERPLILLIGNIDLNDNIQNGGSLFDPRPRPTLLSKRETEMHTLHSWPSSFLTSATKRANVKSNISSDISSISS